MGKDHRKYISIYFEDGLANERKKRDLTISFRFDDPLYEACKNLTSTEIKDTIGIFSFQELTDKSKKEGRTLNNFVKHRLRIKLSK